MTSKLKTMEDAIREGKRRFQENPRLASEVAQIKYALAEWLWSEYDDHRKASELLDDLTNLNFMKKITD